jgi:CheY-like chemotaxis protein
MKFPTTHVLVDNDINYLRGISTILPFQNKIYRYFTKAEEALAWINNTHRNKNCDVHTRSDSKEPEGCIDFDITNVHRAIYSDERFNFVSSVLVDYDMPGINGIDLCRLINNRKIQKILLTGFLGEKEARNALNKGWIDMFLPKGEDSAQKLAELICDADTNYFEEKNGIMSALIKANNKSTGLASMNSKLFFQKIYKSFVAVEYYMLSENGDFLFVDSDGKTKGLSIQDARQRKENIDLADELSVSPDILGKLKAGKVLFCHAGEDSLPPGGLWKPFIFPARLIDKEAGLFGASDEKMFSNICLGITAFRPIFDQSVKDAVKFLIGSS